MKTIEHRRHAKRTKPAPHINSEGVSTARKLGETYLRGNETKPYFDLVITSPKKRAIETAVAMGFAVDETRELLEEVPDSLNGHVAWNKGFHALMEVHGETGEGTRFLKKLRDLFSDIIERVPDGGNALVVSHGGVVEYSALACLPEKVATLGEVIGLCEGIRLTWDNGHWTSVKALRL